jgi:Tfp pilus tip-associated adhesin PilY1
MAIMRKLKTTLLYSVMLCSNSFAAGIFTPNSQPTGWISPPALTNTNLSSGSEKVYWINYNKNEWSGDIVARFIDNNGVELRTGPWDPDSAASKLDSLDFDTGRLIITRDSSGNPIPFRLVSLLPTLSSVVADRQKILNYVRGYRADEIPSGSYRYRKHVLGDILHSTLTYRYYDANTTRLYVGANDGMLHAFDAITGAEIFAYIPSMVIPNLKLLTSNPYSHTYFVDGGLSIANINFNGSIKTYLVGGWVLVVKGFMP